MSILNVRNVRTLRQFRAPIRACLFVIDIRLCNALESTCDYQCCVYKCQGLYGGYTSLAASIALLVQAVRAQPRFAQTSAWKTIMTHQNVLDSGIALIANWSARTSTKFLHVGTVHEFMLPRLEVNNPKLRIRLRAH